MTSNSRHSWIVAVGLVICQISWAAASHIEVDRGATADRLAMAGTNRVKTPVMVRELHIKVALPSGRSFADGELILAHDSATGRFWWSLTRGSRPPFRLDRVDWFVSHSAAYETEDSIVVFRVSPGILHIVEQQGLVARSLDDAQQKALDEISNMAAGLETTGGFGPVGTTVELSRSRIPTDFFQPPLTQALIDRVRVVSLAREGKNWRLIIRGEWDQEIVLDEKFRFVSTRRVDALK